MRASWKPPRSSLSPTCAPGLEAAGLKQERRALRVRVDDLAWEWEDDALILRFRLGPGAYATEVLAELGDIR